MTRRVSKPECWDVVRGSKDQLTDSDVYFRETKEGTHCYSNWYQGNNGELGDPATIPEFSAPAPALFGFDDSIDAYCIPRAHGGRYGGHAGVCVNANLNILSLYGNGLPYNSCRNLEWQVCAAKGLLPGQGSKTIVFAKAPRDLDPHPAGGRPVGMCGGWRGGGIGDCRDGYATDSVFFLEACLFNMLCSNHQELWLLEAGEEFMCDFSEEGVDELRELLT